MSGKPVARLGDKGSHGGVIITGASTVFVNGKPLARVNDLYDCANPNHSPNPIVSGSNSVKGEGQAFAHVGSKTACGATIIEGSPNVFVGDNVFFGDGVVFSNNAVNVSEKYDEQIVAIHSATNKPIGFYPYFIETADGKTYSGRTDDAGHTPRIDSLNSEDFTVFWGEDAVEKGAS